MAAKKRTVSEATRHKLSLAGKKRWRAMSSTQKARATSRLRGGSKKSSRRSSTSVSKRSNPGSSTPRIGASYQAGRMAYLALAQPVREGLFVVKKAKTSQKAMADLRFAVPKGAHLIHLGVTAADVAVDARLRQATALSRGSLTAWAPEGYLILKAYQERASGSIAVHGNTVARVTGYNPNSVNWVPSRAWMYRLLKHGGQGLRLLRRRSPLVHKVTEPIRKMLLAPLGGTV